MPCVSLSREIRGFAALPCPVTEQTRYICNGAAGTSGPATVSRLTTLAPGDSRCASGGALFELGVDDDGDGALDPAEVDGTTFVCNGAAGERGPAGPSGGCQAAPGAGLTLLALVFAARRMRCRALAGPVKQEGRNLLK